MKLASFCTSVCIVIISFLSYQSVFAENQTIYIKNQNTSIESKKRITTIREILYSTSMSFNYSKLAVIIDGLQKEPRGRMKDAQISLSPYVARDTEFTKLFIHELAHYIDIYAIIADKSGHDISDDFYHISWQKPTIKGASQGTMDFVSGYAATNQYEDFAESFVFYIFHNSTFADRALRSESIRQKYIFFANYVFPRGYFQGTDFSIGRVPSYVWDTTKISYSLQKYLYSL